MSRNRSETQPQDPYKVPDNDELPWAVATLCARGWFVTGRFVVEADAWEHAKKQLYARVYKEGELLGVRFNHRWCGPEKAKAQDLDWAETVAMCKAARAADAARNENQIGS